jgi:hypothetical protein
MASQKPVYGAMGLGSAMRKHMAKSGAEEVPYISILPEGDISTIIDFNSYPNHALKNSLDMGQTIG